LQLQMYASRRLKPGLNSLSPEARRPQRRKMIGRSTQLIEGIINTIVTVASSPQIRRRRGISGVSMIQRSGVRSIIPHDTIWKSVKLFWLRR
jgi:hypothetical protein